VRESKALARQNEGAAPFIVKLISSTVPPGTPRMLTEVESDELRETKRQIAEYMRRSLEQGYPSSHLDTMAIGWRSRIR
jgi:hypothetical protein